MLCYIIYPDDLSEDELDSPECLSRLKVQVIQFTSHLFCQFALKTEEKMFIVSQQEIIVSRWVSSRERVEHDEV